MSHQTDLPSQTRAAHGAVSRDAGLQRIRGLTKGAAAVSAFGAVAIGLALAQPAQSQAAPTATNGANTQSTPLTVAPPAQSKQQTSAAQQQSQAAAPQAPLAPPLQQPQAAAPQAPPPAAVSGAS